MKSFESKLDVRASLGIKQERQYLKEKEKESLKPPNSLAARLSAKNVSNAPLNISSSSQQSRPPALPPGQLRRP